MEIRLDPPELGRVQIHLTRLDGGIQAVVLADRPETQDLLRRHAEVLARELGGPDTTTVSLDFAAGGEARGGRDEAAGRTGRRSRRAAAAPSPPRRRPPRRRAASLAGGLDIRL